MKKTLVLLMCASLVLAPACDKSKKKSSIKKSPKKSSIVDKKKTTPKAKIQTLVYDPSTGEATEVGQSTMG